MNFTDLQEAIFRDAKLNVSSERMDSTVQEVKDALNEGLRYIVNRVKVPHWLLRSSSLSVVSGTSVYSLAWFTRNAFYFWTEDARSHVVDALSTANAVANKLRASTATDVAGGPWSVVWYPDTTTADYTYSAATIPYNTTGLTQAGGTNFASAMAGLAVRVNGEPGDITISSVTNTTTAILDRAYIGRLSGVAKGSTPGGLTSGKVELGPPGRKRVQFLPTPNATQTVYYYYIKQPQWMISGSDTPELPEEWHRALLLRAKADIRLFRENANTYNLIKGELAEAMQDLEKLNAPVLGENHTARYESIFPDTNIPKASIYPDVYQR